MASRHPRQNESSGGEPLAARVADLEIRVKLVEARLRQLATARQGEPAEPEAPKRGKPRPRCPGCHLELPTGRRGDTCVWCGFYFEAVEEKAPR